jgi:hypothetical protein
MTIIAIYSVTFRDGDQVRVEVFDREVDALARQNTIAEGGDEVLLQYHTIKVGHGA